MCPILAQLRNEEWGQPNASLTSFEASKLKKYSQAACQLVTPCDTMCSGSLCCAQIQIQIQIQYKYKFKRASCSNVIYVDAMACRVPRWYIFTLFLLLGLSLFYPDQILGPKHTLSSASIHLLSGYCIHMPEKCMVVQTKPCWYGSLRGPRVTTGSQVRGGVGPLCPSGSLYARYTKTSSRASHGRLL